MDFLGFTQDRIFPLVNNMSRLLSDLIDNKYLLLERCSIREMVPKDV